MANISASNPTGPLDGAATEHTGSIGVPPADAIPRDTGNGTANGEDVWGINHFHKIFQFDGNEFVSRDDSRREWKAVSIGLRNEVWALA